MMQKSSRSSKAISPLIATVLLISFTFTIAAILAAWGQNLSAESLGRSSRLNQQIAACNGGVIQYIDTGVQNPVMSGDQIKAQIQVSGVPLWNFTFAVSLNSLTIIYLADTTNTTLSPGPRNIGTIVSEHTAIPRENITSVMITTNCQDVRTIPKPLG